MEMKEITEGIIRDIDELKEILMKEIDVDMLLGMDVTNFKTIQICLKLIDESGELMRAYANTLESQNKKLDMLLERTEERV